MRMLGNLPSLELIRDGEKVVCDEKYQWLRAKRRTDTNFLGWANGAIRAGYSGSFCITNPDDRNDCSITESGESRHKFFLEHFADYVVLLGERELCK